MQFPIGNPHPQMLSSINDQNKQKIKNPIEPQNQGSACVIGCFFTILPKSENDSMADTHILV